MRRTPLRRRSRLRPESERHAAARAAESLRAADDGRSIPEVAASPPGASAPRTGRQRGLSRKAPLRAYSTAKGARSGTFKTCAREGCENQFYVEPAIAVRRKFCSVACAGASYAERYRGRRGTKNPNYRHGRRAGERDREGERRWYAVLGAKCRHPGCPGRDGHRLVLHHVVYRQKIRQLGGDQFDPRNALTVCDGCHTSHHRRGRYVLPLVCLSDESYAFAFELMGPAAYDYLRRRYSGDDPRLDDGLRKAEAA